MSYSFGVRGATKDEVMAKVAAELDQVVSNQSMHSADRAQAEAAAKAFVDVVPDGDDDKEFYVSVSGSVGWRGTLGVDAVITSSSVNVSVSLVAKEAA